MPSIPFATFLADWHAHSANNPTTPFVRKSIEIAVPAPAGKVVMTGTGLAPLHLALCKFSGRSVVFEGCRTAEVALNACTFEATLEFSGCVIDTITLNNTTKVSREVYLRGGKFKEITIQDRGTVQSLHVLEACSIDKLTISNSCKVMHPNGDGPNITVDASQITELVLNSVKLLHNGNEGIAIENRSQIGTMTIKEIETKLIKIHDSTIEKYIHIEGSALGAFHILERSLLRDVAIVGPFTTKDATGSDSGVSMILVSDSTISGELSLVRCAVENIHLTDSEVQWLWLKEVKAADVKVDSSRISKELSLDGCSLEDVLLTRSADVNLIETKSIQVTHVAGEEISATPNELNTSITKCKVMNSRCANVRLGAGSVFGSLLFDSSPLPSGTASGKFDKISFRDLASVQHTLAFNDVQIKDLEAVKFFNLGDITFAGVTFMEHGGVTMDRSNMGRMNLIDVDLPNASYFKYRDSTLANTRFMNTVVPENKLDILDGKKGDHHTFRQLQLAYSNLSLAFKGSEAFALARDYRAKALDAHLSALRADPNSTMRDLFDRFALRVNGLSNGHGHNIARATFFLLIAPMFCYFVYCLTQGVHPSTAPGSIEAFAKVANHYLEFAYVPLRPLESNSKLIDMLGAGQMAVGFWGRVVDILSRVVSGYLIYQFIQAFRHYSKQV